MTKNETATGWQQGRIAVLLNARAGSSHGVDSAMLTDLFLFVGGLEVDVHPVEPPQLTITLQRLVADGYQTLIIGGGDGSLNAAVNCLAGTDVVMGVLPMGTFNLFARDIQLPLTLESSIKKLAECMVHTIDLGQVNELRFLNKTSLGLHPYAIDERDRFRMRWGVSKRWAMSWALLKALWWSPNLHLRLDDGSQTEKVRTPFIVIGNNRYESAALADFRRDHLDEGCLGIFYAPCANRLLLLRLIIQAVIGRPLRQLEQMQYRTLTKVSISARRRRSLRLSIDGEIIRLPLPLNFVVQQRALKVLIPPC